MLKVGLTGSIAVGKSFVCSVMLEMGVPVLDADITAREVVAKGTEGLDEIVRHFGKGVLLEDGELDRKKLGSIVFADEEKRLLLNTIVHPRVREVQNAWLESVRESHPNGIAVIDAALLIESGGYKRLDKIIVVWCQPALQLQRLIARDHIDENAAKLRVSSQMPQEEKKKYADHLIDTSNGYEDTREQVRRLVSELRGSIA